MRTLEQRFVDDLREGVLQPLLEVVKHDQYLNLEIRANMIQVFDQGLNFMTIKHSKETYECECHARKKQLSIDEVVMNLEELRQEVKARQVHIKEQGELSEGNQWLLNQMPSNYYVVDHEYKVKEHEIFFDLLAVKQIEHSQQLQVVIMKQLDTSNVTQVKQLVEQFRMLHTLINGQLIREVIHQAKKQLQQKLVIHLVEDSLQSYVVSSNERLEYNVLFTQSKVQERLLKRELKKAMVFYPNVCEFIDVRLWFVETGVISIETFLNDEKLMMPPASCRWHHLFLI